MKLEVIHKGVHDAKGNRVEVGAVIDVDGDTIPAWLVNKVRAAGESSGKAAADDGEPKTAVDVLKMASGHFMTFKAAAKKLLGDKTPDSKAEIVAALEELATQP